MRRVVVAIDPSGTRGDEDERSNDVDDALSISEQVEL